MLQSQSELEGRSVKWLRCGEWCSVGVVCEKGE